MLGGHEVPTRMLQLPLTFNTRSRRRASQPRPGGVASRCRARSALFALGEFGERPDGARSAGKKAAPGCAFFWVLFFAQAKKSTALAAREPHSSC
jgi:hypothetical protein